MGGQRVQFFNASPALRCCWKDWVPHHGAVWGFQRHLVTEYSYGIWLISKPVFQECEVKETDRSSSQSCSRKSRQFLPHPSHWRWVAGSHLHSVGRELDVTTGGEGCQEFWVVSDSLGDRGPLAYIFQREFARKAVAGRCLPREQTGTYSGMECRRSWTNPRGCCWRM